MSLHFNKGLAGAPEAELAAARDTAMNPAVLDAFALALEGGLEAFKRRFRKYHCVIGL